MYDLIIIGGGPAGITAGIYAARKKLKTLFLTKNFVGQTGEAGLIENWPGDIRVSGPELMDRFERHLRAHEIAIEEDEVVSITKKKTFVVETEDGKFESRAVIVASGRSPRPLGVPGEKKFVGKGVVYCTTCDAPVFQDKKIVVVGGGNSGFESAIEMTDYTKDVYLFEESDDLRADKVLIDRAKKKGIKVFTKRKVLEVRGGKFVDEIAYENVDDGKKKTFKVEGVFVKIGSVPVVDFVKDLVDLDDAGDIKIDPILCLTKTEGLFAAGDVTDVRDKQIITAAAEGAKAALSAYDYLKK